MSVHSFVGFKTETCEHKQQDGDCQGEDGEGWGSLKYGDRRSDFVRGHTVQCIDLET